MSEPMPETAYFLDVSHHDRTVWLQVPTEWPVPGQEEEFPDLATWADRAARAIWTESGLNPGSTGMDYLTGMLTRAAEEFSTVYPDFELLVHLPGPLDLPLPVAIGGLDTSDLSPDEAERELRGWAGEGDPEAVEPPLIEDFASPRLGKGLRGLRYTIGENDPDRTVNAALHYAWDVPQLGCQIYMVTASPDPAHLIAAMDDLDALARTIGFSTEP